ncbi:hypothetical protein ACET3Z_004439 [Daucus carota]
MPPTGRGGRRNHLRRTKPILPSHNLVDPTTSEPPKPHLTGRTLPPELLLQILYRTEVKALVRFKCVSRSWYALINHPMFIKKHLSVSTSNKSNSHVIVKANNAGGCGKSIILLRVDKVPVRLLDIDTRARDSDGYPRKINFVDFSKKMHVAGSVNGVVLVMHIDEMMGRFVALWNPGINQWKAVKLDDLGGDDIERSAFGLGYDEGNDDIKIVRVITRSSCMNEFIAGFKWARVEIYSANRGCWKGVDHEGELLFWPRQYHCNFIVKGAPYFVGMDVMPDSAVAFQHEILARFDPCTGFYKKVDYPEHFREMSTWVQPFEYQDSVAVMVQSTPGLLDEPMIDLYVLDDDTASWTKMYTIGPFPYKEFHYPRQSFKTGEIVIEEQLHTRDLYLYDPKASYVSSLIGIDSLKPLWMQSYSHTESLVSVKGMELIGRENKNKKNKPKKLNRMEVLSKEFESVLHV